MHQDEFFDDYDPLNDPWGYEYNADREPLHLPLRSSSRRNPSSAIFTSIVLTSFFWLPPVVCMLIYLFA